MQPAMRHISVCKHDRFSTAQKLRVSANFATSIPLRPKDIRPNTESLHANGPYLHYITSWETEKVNDTKCREQEMQDLLCSYTSSIIALDSYTFMHIVQHLVILVNWTGKPNTFSRFDHILSKNVLSTKGPLLDLSQEISHSVLHEHSFEELNTTFSENAAKCTASCWQETKLMLYNIPANSTYFL